MASRTARNISSLSLLLNFTCNDCSKQATGFLAHAKFKNGREHERTRDMAANVEAITKRLPIRHQAWSALSAHYRKVREVHLRQLFADDPKRGQRVTAEAVGL